MNDPSPQPLSIPHLKLARRASSQFVDGFSDIPQAGPSRTSTTPNGDLGRIKDNDPDAQSTSKLAYSTSIAPPRTSHSPQDTSETPAARLRALLSRIPSNSASKTVSHRPQPASMSEIESDFDPPQLSPATPSVARESLKDLFSRALRDPGDTPKKERRRRNSIDISEVEASPRVARERAKNKGKRRSLSDEEAEKPSRSSQPSETSHRSSQAATFDSLRERLINSHSSSRKVAPPTPHDRMFVSPTRSPVPDRYSGDESDVQDDTATFFRDPNSSRATPPAATSTPQKSLQLPSQLPSQSNLLENDLEMQNAMIGFDSFEGDLNPSSRPLSFPPPRAQQSVPSHSHSRNGSGEHPHGYLLKHANSESNGNVNHSSSSPSSVDSMQHRNYDRERERRWNRNHSKTPKRPTPPDRHPHGPHNFDGDTSPKPNPVGSQTVYRDHIHDPESEHDLERDREWNKRGLTLPPSTSSGSLHQSPERPSTSSHLIHPQSRSHRQSPVTDRSAQHQNRSLSPTSSDSESVNGADLREPNWNAPRPNWNLHVRHRDGSLSPVSSPTRSSSSRRQLKSQSRHRMPAESPQAITARDTFLSRDSAMSNSPNIKASAASATPKESDSNQMQSSVSRLEWQFPRNRTPLPPLELDEYSPEQRLPSGRSDLRDLPSPTPSSRSMNRTPNSVATSHVSKKLHEEASISTRLVNGHREQPRRDHKATVAESSAAAGIVFSRSDEEVVPRVADPALDDDDELPHQATSPITHVDIPLASPSESPTSRSRSYQKNSQARLEKGLASPASSSEISPPPVPSPALDFQPQTVSRSTPRRSSFTSSRVDSKSVAQKDLSGLQGQPTSPDREVISNWKGSSSRLNGDAKQHQTTLNTPRPPGAWASTPARSRSRSTSLSNDVDISRHNGNPVAPLSRAGSLPPSTPALPGGWMTTPSRRSSLMVRFDVERHESDMSLSDGGSEPSRYLPGALRESPGGNNAVSNIATPVPVDVEPQGLLRKKTSDPYETPVRRLPRSFRKSPTIRLVDAYGEVTNDGNGNVTTDVSVRANGSLRNKTFVRIVDAMGRQVEETSSMQESKLEDDVPLNHTEAVARVRKGLANLLDGFDERDSSSDNLRFDNQHLAKLERESQEARVKRKQLSQTLLTAQNAEGKLGGKYGSLAASVRESHILMNRWVLVGFVFLQIVLVLALYRFATARARDLFLTTYYDPFYANLYLYITKPDTTHYSISSAHLPHASWSMISVMSTIRRDGWITATSGLRHNLTSMIWEWQRHAWETWGVDNYGPRLSWPPT